MRKCPRSLYLDLLRPLIVTRRSRRSWLALWWFDAFSLTLWQKMANLCEMSGAPVILLPIDCLLLRRVTGFWWRLIHPGRLDIARVATWSLRSARCNQRRGIQSIAGSICLELLDLCFECNDLLSLLSWTLPLYDFNTGNILVGPLIHQCVRLIIHMEYWIPLDRMYNVTDTCFFLERGEATENCASKVEYLAWIYILLLPRHSRSVSTCTIWAHLISHDDSLLA